MELFMEQSHERDPKAERENGLDHEDKRRFLWLRKDEGSEKRWIYAQVGESEGHFKIPVKL